jgi:hypothetical protein
MLESSPPTHTKVLQPLLPPHTFSLYNSSCSTEILLEHLYIRECRPFPYTHNQLRDKSRLPSSWGKPSSSGPTPPGGQPPFHVPSGGKPPFTGQTPVVTNLWQGGNLLFSGNPSQSWGVPQGGTFNQPTKGGHHTITHKEEYQILFLLDYLLDNLIRVSQIPPGVLKDNNLILPKGLMFTLLKGQNIYPPQGKTVYPSSRENCLSSHKPNQPTYTPQNQPGFPFHECSSTTIESYLYWSTTTIYGRTYWIQLSTSTSLWSYWCPYATPVSSSG